MRDEPQTPPASEAGGRTDSWHEEAPDDIVGTLPRPTTAYQDIDWAIVADIHDEPGPRRTTG